MIGSGKKCPNCGGTVSAGRQSCQNCGRSFSAQVVELGDRPGHEFHGNQHTGSQGGGDSGDKAKSYGEEHPVKGFLFPRQEKDSAVRKFGREVKAVAKDLLHEVTTKHPRGGDIARMAEKEPVWVGQLPFSARVDQLEQALVALAAEELDEA